MDLYYEFTLIMKLCRDKKSQNARLYPSKTILSLCDNHNNRNAIVDRISTIYFSVLARFRLSLLELSSKGVETSKKELSNSPLKRLL